MKTKTVTVVAREKFPYAGINRFPGDWFEASAEDARILKLVGRVHQNNPPKAVAPAPEPESNEPIDPSPRRGRSQRKDIVPED